MTFEQGFAIGWGAAVFLVVGTWLLLDWWLKR